MFAYHGSDQTFSSFNTLDVCVAKSESEARRYGKNLYRVEFEEFKFETPTIFVLLPTHIKSVTLISS